MASFADLRRCGLLWCHSNLHFDWKRRGFELCFEFAPGFITKSDTYVTHIICNIYKLFFTKLQHKNKYLAGSLEKASLLNKICQMKSIIRWMLPSKTIIIQTVRLTTLTLFEIHPNNDSLKIFQLGEEF